MLFINFTLYTVYKKLLALISFSPLLPLSAGKFKTGQIQNGEKLFASENGAKITLYSLFLNMIIVMDFVNYI